MVLFNRLWQWRKRQIEIKKLIKERRDLLVATRPLVDRFRELVEETKKSDSMLVCVKNGRSKKLRKLGIILKLRARRLEKIDVQIGRLTEG